MHQTIICIRYPLHGKDPEVRDAGGSDELPHHPDDKLVKWPLARMSTQRVRETRLRCAVDGIVTFAVRRLPLHADMGNTPETVGYYTGHAAQVRAGNTFCGGRVTASRRDDGSAVALHDHLAAPAKRHPDLLRDPERTTCRLRKTTGDGGEIIAATLTGTQSVASPSNSGLAYCPGGWCSRSSMPITSTRPKSQSECESLQGRSFPTRAVQGLANSADW